MARTTTKIGDIFTVSISDNSKKYFQYISNDLTQLNSDVIRAFSKIYSINETPDLSVIVADEVDFYAHCVLKFGIKMNLWEKVGNITNVGELKHILFRGSSDSGSKAGEQVAISKNWYIWRINDRDFTSVGELNDENKRAEIGIVVNPYDVLDRMKTGKYNFFYPSYK